MIPDRGTWVEVQFDQNDLLYVYIDRRRRRRKFLITTLLRAFGHSSNQQIIDLFYNVETWKVSDALKREDLFRYVLAEAVYNVRSDKSVVLLKEYETLTKRAVNEFKDAGIEEIKVIDTTVTMAL